MRAVPCRELHNPVLFNIERGDSLIEDFVCVLKEMGYDSDFCSLWRERSLPQKGVRGYRPVDNKICGCLFSFLTRFAANGSNDFTAAETLTITSFSLTVVNIQRRQ